MKKHSRRIGPRVSLQLLVLLAAVFLCVFAAFNLFFRSYVQKNVRTQLDAIQQAMVATIVGGRDRDGDRGADADDGTAVAADGAQSASSGAETLPDSAALPAAGALPGADADGAPDMDAPSLPALSNVLHNTIRSEAKVFNVDADGVLTDYDKNDDPTELSAVGAALHAAGAALDGARYVHLSTAQGEYYVSSIADPVIPDVYMVFALNVSDVRALWNTINAALAVIMAAAMAVCLLVSAALARTITQPVRTLSAFAEALGSGDFARRDLRFRDAEFQELADAMNRSAERLDASDREQRTFFQNVSHELRTPLMSIRCYAEGISCGVMEPKQSGAVILSETDRLSELVEDLLYISRIDRCPLPEKAEEGDLRETVSLCASGLRALADKGGIALRFAFDDAPVLFTYNENHMCRAVNNLLSNALRYAKSEIVLGCRSTPGAVEISVTDDGAGVAPEDLPHVFDRFYKGKGGKAGIGLAIVKSVTELYGGTAAVLPGPGGRFVLRFPVPGAPADTVPDKAAG